MLLAVAGASLLACGGQSLVDQERERADAGIHESPAGANAQGGGTAIQDSGVTDSGGSDGVLDAGSGEADAGVPVASIDGLWDVAGFEDPLQWQFVQRGSKLGGIACIGGLPSPGQELNSNLCGPITGEVSGRNVTAEFTAYSARHSLRAMASADGQRIAGSLQIDHGSSSLPLLAVAGRRDTYVRSCVRPTPLRALKPAAYRLTWLKALVDHGEFDRAATYDVFVRTIWVHGSLGAFWPCEITLPSESESASFTAGPVVETSPDSPISVSLSEVSQGVMVVVAMPSGGVYYFAGEQLH